MNEARTPCVITGCKRTFRGRLGDVMCGRHTRCDPYLWELLKEARKVYRHMYRKWPSLRQPWGRPEPLWLKDMDPHRRVQWLKYRALMRGVCRRLDRRWEAVRARAQAMQDAGHWNKPRRRKLVIAGCVADPEALRGSVFEDQFQRLKLAQSIGKVRARA